MLKSFVLTLFVLGCYSSTDWYVSVEGNDGNQGTATSPFATLGKALGVAKDSDVINVLAGTYTGAGSVNLRSSRDVTIVGAGADATIFKGDQTQGVSFVSTTSETTLVNLTVSNFYTSIVVQAGHLKMDSCTMRSANVNILMADVSGATFVTLSHMLIGDVRDNGNRRAAAVQTQCRTDPTTERTVTIIDTHFDALAAIVWTADSCDSDTKDIYNVTDTTWTGEVRYGFAFQSGQQKAWLSNSVVQVDNPTFGCAKGSFQEVTIVNCSFAYVSDVVESKTSTTLHIYDSEITQGAGEAISMLAGGSVTMSGCTVTDGNPYGDSGGGIHLAGGANAYVTNSHFENNYSPSQGGVFSTSQGSELTAYDCTFVNNHAKNAAGVVSCVAGAQVTLINNMFKNNTVAGAISVVSCEPGCIFTSINNKGDGAHETCQ